MKLKPLTTVALAAGFVIVGIAVTMATGLWQTESDKTPRTLPLEDTATVNEQTGETQYDPADIRGSYTFGEISELYHVPLADIAEAFGLEPDQAAAFQTKSLSTLYPDSAVEIGTASVRLFTASYLGVPYQPTEETYLPATAAEVLVRNGQMTDEQAAYLLNHTF